MEVALAAAPPSQRVPASRSVGNGVDETSDRRPDAGGRRFASAPPPARPEPRWLAPWWARKAANAPEAARLDALRHLWDEEQEALGRLEMSRTSWAGPLLPQSLGNIGTNAQNIAMVGQQAVGSSANPGGRKAQNAGNWRSAPPRADPP